MNPCFLRWPVIPAAILTLALGGPGCDVINPQLFSSLGGNSSATLTPPEGYIALIIMNRTSTTAQANMTVTKQNGGKFEMQVGLAPYDSTSKDDHAMATFECDVATIQLNSVVYDSGAGQAIEIQFDYAPFRIDENMFCGDTIYVTIQGTAPNVTAIMGIY